MNIFLTIDEKEKKMEDIDMPEAKDTDLLLLQCSGAYDLTLIEEASELFASYMSSGNNIEKLLQTIVSERRGRKDDLGKYYEVLNSETFSDEVEDSEEKEEYDEVIKNYRKYNEVDRFKIEKKNMIALIALKIDDVGHYAVFIYDGIQNSVELFDSMQFGTCGSHYTPRFKEIASNIFGIDVSRVYHHNIPLPHVPQITGGFEYYEPLYASLHQTRVPNSVRIQVTESQNHYCYMWSIWYMHFRILGYNPVEILAEINKMKVDPLFVIKRYIYSFSQLLKWPIKRKKFFNEQFPRIWTNSLDPLAPERASETFGLYKLEMPKNSKTVDDVLRSSIDYKLKVDAIALTPLPKEIKDQCKNLDPRLKNYDKTFETELMYFVKHWKELGMSLDDLRIMIEKYKGQMYSSLDNETGEYETGNNVMHVVNDLDAAKLLLMNGARDLLFMKNSYGLTPYGYLQVQHDVNVKPWSDIYALYKQYYTY